LRIFAAFLLTRNLGLIDFGTEKLGSFSNMVPAIRYNPRPKAWDFHFYRGSKGKIGLFSDHQKEQTKKRKVGLLLLFFIFEKIQIETNFCQVL
jgi:hypothetical protein